MKGIEIFYKRYDSEFLIRNAEKVFRIRIFDVDVNGGGHSFRLISEFRKYHQFSCDGWAFKDLESRVMFWGVESLCNFYIANVFYEFSYKMPLDMEEYVCVSSENHLFWIFLINLIMLTRFYYNFERSYFHPELEILEPFENYKAMINLSQELDPSGEWIFYDMLIEYGRVMGWEGGGEEEE